MDECFDRNAAVVRARELRRSPSLPEGLLWQILRQRPGGFKFRRQHPVGPYVTDFYCPAARLIIEVDGASHDMGGNPGRDAERDTWMKERGLRVLRFTAAEILKDRDSAVTMIVRVCRL